MTRLHGSSDRRMHADVGAFLLAGVAAAALFAASTGFTNAAETGDPQVRVAEGLVRGQVRDGVTVFRALPYAAAPVGSLRFRPPQPAKAWSGVREAVEDGPSCPQGPTLDPAGKASTNEDCLRLNVFAPAAPSSGKMPVLVWIHGGGFSEGFGGARQYDPSTIVKEGGFIVVSINYRLGTLGLLATKGLDEADGMPSGNYAIRDQQAALRWVRKNIAAFGGDPGNVTIDGESAGAASVLALVSSPLSKDLFQKAIAQSPPFDSHAWPRAQMEQSSDELAEKLGCKADAGQADCLRKLPVEAILKIRSRLGLVQDGQVLPVDTFVAFRSGKFNHVPMIIGSNLHEGYFSISGAERNLGHAMTEADYTAQMKSNFAQDADAVMKQYPAGSAPSPAAALGDAVSDLHFSCYADMARVGMSSFAPIYGFEMNEPDPVQQQPRPKFSLANTSYHTSDLAYLFDFETAGPLKGDAAALGRKLRGYWIAFVKTGSPDAKGQPQWPQFHAQAGTVLELSNTGGLTSDFETRHRCRAMEQAGLVPGS